MSTEAGDHCEEVAKSRTKVARRASERNSTRLSKQAVHINSSFLINEIVRMAFHQFKVACQRKKVDDKMPYNCDKTLPAGRSAV